MAGISLFVCLFFPVWLSGLAFVFLFVCFFTHFVACWRDLDDKLKTFTNGKRHSTELILRAPAVILKGVENHFVPSVKSGVHVHGYVAGLRRVAAQVDDKPAGEKQHESHKQSVSFSSEKHGWSQTGVKLLKMSPCTIGLFPRLRSINLHWGLRFFYFEKEESILISVGLCVSSAVWLSTT